MIITCPHCSSKFAVKAEAIGKKGRKVKCAKCKENWFQEPDEAALKQVEEIKPQEAPSETEAVPAGSNVPAIAKEAVSKSIKLAFAASLFIFFFVVSIVSANSVLPSISWYYSMFGIHSSRELALYDIVVEKVEAGRYHDLVVSGKIVNESEFDKYLPNLRITVYSKNKKKLKTITLDSDGAVVAPGEAIDFQNRIPRIAKNLATVALDLGNGLDLASR